jgi:ABC-2 type transport system permease protein
MSAYIRLTVTEVKLFLREWQTMFWTLLFPPLMLLLFGEIYGNEPREMLEGYGFVDQFVPGLVAIGIAGTSLFTIGATLATYRERQILRRLRVTPLHPLVIIVAHLVSGLVLVVLDTILLVVLAGSVYQTRIGGSLLAILGALGLGTLSFFALGFLLASLLPTARAANAAAMALFMPMISLSGAIFPSAFLPDSFQKVAQIIPLTYVVNVLKAAWLGQGLDQALDLVILIALGLAGGTLSVVFFRWE